MNTQTIAKANDKATFHSAEQLWFWFLYSKSVRNGYAHGQMSGSRRVCELLDVETLVTKLYLSGKLSDEQLAVLKEYGDRRRAPHQHIYAENRAATVWRTAMQTLTTAATSRGWIE